MSNIEAPLLDSFFSNQGLGTSLNYCAICLRTEKQRRMVSNSSLVTFTNIIVMNKAWQVRLRILPILYFKIYVQVFLLF